MPVKVKSPIIEFYGLQTPFRCGLFGSSRTGKTSLIYKLLEHKMFDKDFKTIYYCYPSIYDNDLDWHEKLDYTIEYVDHLPTVEFFHEIEPHSLLILDDCWFSCSQDSTIRDLFKVLSGKKDISVFITSQNPFEGGSNARTIRNNLNYYFLFRNLGDQQINKKLAQQLGLQNEFEYALKDVKKEPYEPVFLNLDVKLKHEALRVSTHILDLPIVTV